MKQESVTSKTGSTSNIVIKFVCVIRIFCNKLPISKSVDDIHEPMFGTWFNNKKHGLGELLSQFSLTQFA